MFSSIEIIIVVVVLYAADDGQLLPLTCVHPMSRRHFNKPIVVVKSPTHDSTGSTVNTFLPQDDLMAAYENIPMPTVAEEDSDD